MKMLKYIKWLPITILLLLFSSISFYEWWQLGVVADPKIISLYPFGGEGPVAGIWAYESVESYVLLSLISGLTIFCLAISFIIFRKKESAPLFLLMYLLSFLTIFIFWIL